MIKCYATFFLLLSLTWHNLQAGEHSYKTLNITVDYVNQHLESFWLSYKDLTELNRNLNSYFQSEGKHIPLWRSVFLEMPPTQELANIPPAFITEMRELAEIRKEHRAGMEALEQYVQQKAYLSDIEGEKAYLLLDKMQAVFERFGKVHRTIEQVISEENARQGLMEPDDAFLFVVQELHTHLARSRLLLKAIKQQETGNARKHLAILKDLTERSAQRQTKLLSPLSPRPNSEHDPSKRFEAVIAQSKALIQLAEDFFGTEPIDPFYRAEGRAYYFYNQYLVNKFSRKGESLTTQFNRFLSLHELPLLRAIGEAHSFKVLKLFAESAEMPKSAIPKEIAPVHLIFLLDVSGSMRQEDKFPLFKSSFLYLVSNLRPEDRISLISYSGESKVHVEAISPQQKKELSHIIHNLSAEGKTNIQQGLTKAYKVAQTNFIAGGNNRIVLVSDGGFYLQSQMLQIAQKGQQNDIQLSTLYMGHAEAEARARLLPLARQGGGNYTYVEAQNAQKALIREVLSQ
ncbi:MAG: VWA domain-containing protein [Bacteroidota bacterium]